MKILDQRKTNMRERCSTKLNYNMLWCCLVVSGRFMLPFMVNCSFEIKYRFSSLANICYLSKLHTLQLLFGHLQVILWKLVILEEQVPLIWLMFLHSISGKAQICENYHLLHPVLNHCQEYNILYTNKAKDSHRHQPYLRPR